MKTIIAGSRGLFTPNISTKNAVKESGFKITEVVSGCARGADEAGEEWAKRRGVPVKKFPADWKKHGKEAGALRNEQMAEYADALIAVWDGKSRGTKHMISVAKSRGLKVFIYDVNK